MPSPTLPTWTKPSRTSSATCCCVSARNFRRASKANSASLRDLERPSDEADLASREEQRQWQLRLLEREKKLLDKIDEALERLARGDYGWCQETGEPIGLRRLLLRPTATLCIEAKERQEKRERHVRHN